MKVRMLEKYVIYKNKSKSRLLHFFKKIFFKDSYIIEVKYLIERFYKKSNFSEYLVCSDYDFKSNTFRQGFFVFDIQTAYKVFNDYVKDDSFPIFEIENSTDEVLNTND